MSYVVQGTDGLWRVYDTECDGVIAGPYDSKEEAQFYCDDVNVDE